MTSLWFRRLRDTSLSYCIRLELVLTRIGIASVPIDVLLNCDDVVYAVLALHG